MTGLEWGAALMAEPVRSAIVDAVFKSGAGFRKRGHHPLARQGMNSCFGNEEPVRFPLRASLRRRETFLTGLNRGRGG